MEKLLTEDQDPLQMPVRYVRGVGESRARQLARLDIETVQDLLWKLPARYEDRSVESSTSSWSKGDVVSFHGSIAACGYVQPKFGKGFFQAHIKSGGNLVQARWYGARYLEDQLHPDMPIQLYGKIEPYKGKWVFQHPEMEVGASGEDDSLNLGRVVPVYNLTEDLSQRHLRRIVSAAIQQFSQKLEDALPESVLEEERLLPLREAVVQAHFPDSIDKAKAARFRLAFEEFFIMQLVLLARRLHTARNVHGHQIRASGALRRQFTESLPFSLTAAQEKVLQEIRGDMEAEHPMHRLLQGDVGSGKTVVAAVAMADTVEAGFQAAVMAPTEILAVQHFRTFRNFFKDLSLKCVLLTGDQKTAERQACLQKIASGAVQVVIGTHAVIQDAVKFKRLGLVVIDEQHKFGVEQRGRLYDKGESPDVLVMTATPIPRSLAMTVYGDLDVSIIDELPRGRPAVITRVIDASKLEKAYGFVLEQVKAGRQAYMVYPLVEASETSDLKAAEEMYEQLRKGVFREARVGLLHGKLKSDAKHAVMEAFRKGELDILVCTIVVEVGLDQPNATVMLIEHAERFGLAQLHQMRGRVGRGVHKSYCILQAESGSKDAWRRLKVMEATRDGFRIAEEDLDIRGMGNLLGREQSGFPGLRVAHPVKDVGALKAARKAAARILERDPLLEHPDFTEVRNEANHLYRDASVFLKVG